MNKQHIWATSFLEYPLFLSKKQQSSKRIFKDYLYHKESSDKQVKFGKLLIIHNKETCPKAFYSQEL